MAQFTVTVTQGVHAEIVGGDKFGFDSTPIILDPLSLSYSGLGMLCFYDLVIDNISGLTEVRLLKNGKNSRFTAVGPGTCDIILTVQDEYGNSDTDTITITIA